MFIMNIKLLKTDLYEGVFFQSLKKKKKAEGKLSQKEEMSQKEKEIFEAQLMKEAEIRDRLKEASSSRFSVCLFFKGAM